MTTVVLVASTSAKKEKKLTLTLTPSAESESCIVKKETTETTIYNNVTKYMDAH